ncbi:MAG: GntR family transcriptional regulator [Gaiellales bacterium]
MEGAGTKADEIAFAIEEDIVSGQLEPGSVLRQEQLSERFAVSRTPIREALRRLAALGLVSFEPNKGVRVRMLSREELREAFLVRAELESLATELAVPNMTAEDLAELDAAEARFSALTLELRRKTREGEHDATLISEWARANHAFHDVIYAAANVPYIERLAKSARRTFLGQTVWAAGLDIDELYARNDLQHRAIREAIAAGSQSGARTLAREHVLASGHMQQVILDHMGAQLHERDAGRRRSA